MKPTTTLILALVVLGLGAFVYFYEIKGGEERGKAEEEGKKIFALEADSVRAISLQEAGVAFEKRGSAWHLVAPVEYLADEGAVNALLNRIASAKREREISSSAAEYRNYGLLPASETIVLEYQNKKDTLYLGDKSATNAMVYVRRNSDPHVILTEAAVLTNAQKTLHDWRDKSLMKFETNEATRLSLTTPSGRFDLYKEGETWRLAAPLQAEADASKVSSILSKMSYSRVTDFVAESLDDAKYYGLDNPSYIFTIALGASALDTSGAQKTMHFGRRTGVGYYAHDPSRSQVFLVDSTVVNELKVDALALRNKRVAQFESFRVDYLALQYPETLIVCEKDTASQWRMTSPDSAKAKSWKVSNLTGVLADMQAVAFIDEDKTELTLYGLDKPRAAILVKEKGAELAHVLIGKAKGDRVYVKSADSPMVVLVKKEEADRLIVAVSELKE
ncbi:DUF4340 domain-containing protein [candidate division KSB1 bacterium]|nr:DUF4340 domain-containing protein [candidate division KSB1 bacterium]